MTPYFFKPIERHNAMNQTARAYEPASYSDGIAREIDRLRNLSGLGWAKEARTLCNFGLKEDMSVLEVASGPGFYSEKLLELLPHGKLTCVEIEEEFVRYAKKYLDGKKTGSYQVEQGSVLELPYASEAFDFVIARLIFHHLSDPVRAINELIRVLKPGGKLVIADYDAKTAHMLSPIIPGSELVHEKAIRAHAARGGDAYVGRKLWRLMTDACLAGVELEAVVLHSGEAGMGTCATQFDPNRLLPLVRAGVISEHEYTVYAEETDKFLKSPDAFYMNILVFACGTRPSVTARA